MLMEIVDRWIKLSRKPTYTVFLEEMLKTSREG